MILKPVDPAAVIRDPVTKQPLPASGDEVPENTYWTRRWLDGATWRRDGNEWVRRLPDGAVERVPAEAAPPPAPPVEAAPPAQPTDHESVAPLATR